MHAYNDFVRTVLIKWYQNKTINVIDVGLKSTSQKAESSTSRNNDNETSRNETARSKTTRKNETAEMGVETNQVEEEIETIETLNDTSADLTHKRRLSLNGWQKYMSENLEKSSDESFGEIAKKARKSWNSLSSEERKNYNTKAREGKTIPPCHLCGAAFNYAKRRKEHMNICPKTFACTKCELIFESPQALKAHDNKHSHKFMCDKPECGKCFECASKLSRHQKTHDKSKDIMCPVCNKKFSRKDNMVRHQKTKHK
ncbi:zinc finger protein 691-like [Clytia hemisphaerica]|uniref:C2H2-type domain-containing protein n=1 Tax=Clytia hemisphaerica TaxID=252671 RepID=A0A7M5V387_9CNID